MTNLAVILVTISAFIHATWNLLGKRQNPSTAFFFVATGFAAICFSPLLLVYRDAFTFIPPRLWLWLGLTSLFELVYYIGLAGAYQHGDLSVAYPLARALPVIMVAILTGLLSLGKPLSTLGIIGILAVVIGCLLLPLQSLRQLHLRDYLNLCCALALVAALGTTGYTLVDNQALFDLRSASGMPLSDVQVSFFYLALESISIALAMGAYVMVSRLERRELGKVWETGKGIALLTGILMMGTYGLVLTALAYTTNVSYVTAFRQLSIPFGAILGILVLKEPAYPARLASIGIIFTGLVLIVLA